MIYSVGVFLIRVLVVTVFIYVVKRSAEKRAILANSGDLKKFAIKITNVLT